MSVTLVDSISKVGVLLGDLEGLPTDPPSLYVDIEGIKLCRYGSISIIAVYNLPGNRVYLVDVFTLQGTAFDTANTSGVTFRSILESNQIPKVFFDVRNDSDALNAHFHVRLRGVRDVQLMEAASRQGPKTRLAGLANCVRLSAQLDEKEKEHWEAVKQTGIRLFAPENGGSYEVFNMRPLSPEIVEYCAQDVRYLPMLYEIYAGRLSKGWRERVNDETNYRLLESWHPSYEPKGTSKVFTPWSGQMPRLLFAVPPNLP